MMTTQDVLNKHLDTFIKGKGLDAIVEDYHENAVLIHDDKTYIGKEQIKLFFTQFIQSLPSDASQRFSLKNMIVEKNIAYINWYIENNITLGTDTFYINDGKIASQTFAMT